MVHFNAEPILLMYPDNDTIKNITDSIQLERPEYEFTTTQRDTHYLWNIDDPKKVAILQTAFGSIKSMYIADGQSSMRFIVLTCKGISKVKTLHITDQRPITFL